MSEQTITTYHPNGNKHEVYQVLNCKKHGKYEKYLSNGFLAHYCYYDNDILHGEYMMVFKDNTKRIKNYVNGRLNGIETIYYNDLIDSQFNWKDDVKEGLVKQWASCLKRSNLIKNIQNNYLCLSYYIINNKKNGEFIEYHENGNIYKKYYFKDNKKHGEYLIYDINGILEYSGQFIEDLREGLWYFYGENNNITKKVPYVNDKINGEIISYTETGKIRSIKTFVNDIPHGRSVSYEYFIDDKNTGFMKEHRVDILKYFSSKKNKRFEKLNDPYTVEEIYGNNGLKHGEFTKKFYFDANDDSSYIYLYIKSYHQDKLNGYSLIWNIDGSPYFEGNYENGECHGLIKNYTDSGIIKNEIEFVHGVKNGSFKYYYPNGKIKHEGTYLNNKEYGTIIHYRESGFYEKIHKITDHWKEITNFRINGSLHSHLYVLPNNLLCGYSREYDENGLLIKEEYHLKPSIHLNKFILTEEDRRLEIFNLYKQYGIFKELYEKTWHPTRVLKWCIPTEFE